MKHFVHQNLFLSLFFVTFAAVTTYFKQENGQKI